MKNIGKLIFTRYWNSLLIFEIIFILGSCVNNQKKVEYINSNGETTIGTVYKRFIDLDKKTKDTTYGLKFDFYVGDSLLNNSYYKVTREVFNEAIVGMKYNVKYLADNPNINSIILIDQPVVSEFINIKKETTRISRTYENEDLKKKSYIGFQRGEEIPNYIFISKIPYGNQLTWRNDSLVLTTDLTVKFNEVLEKYDTYIKHNKEFINGEKHYLIDSSTGKVIDTLESYAPDFNTSKVQSAFYSAKIDTISVGRILIYRYTIDNNYKDFRINFEKWDPKWRCPGEDRIAIYKDTTNVKNYTLFRGVGDYILDNNNIVILTSYSEDSGGRHLLKISLDSLIQDIR